MTCLESHNPSGLRIECRAAHTFYIVFTGTLDLVQQWRICNTQFMVFKESISLQPQSTHIRNESPGNDHGHSMRLRRTQILLILLGKHFFFFFEIVDEKFSDQLSWGPLPWLMSKVIWKKKGPTNASSQMPD